MPSWGKRVAVIGGGNAAIDSARTALRMGAEVTIVYRRERKDMPAIKEEIERRCRRGREVRVPRRAAPDRRRRQGQRARRSRLRKTRLGEYDASGRRKPVPTDEVHAASNAIR